MSILNKSSEIYENHQKSSIEWRDKVENEYFYEAESNLIWIKSVISLLDRRKQKKAALNQVILKLNNLSDKTNESDYINEQTILDKDLK